MLLKAGLLKKDGYGANMDNPLLLVFANAEDGCLPKIIMKQGILSRRMKALIIGVKLLKITQNMLIHDLVVHHVARMPADPMLDTDHDVDMDAPPLM